MKSSINRTFLVIALCFVQLSCFAQIRYKLTKTSKNLYQVSIIPEKNYPFPLNAIATAQVTIKVPSDQGFIVDNFKSSNTDDIWTLNTKVHSEKIASTYEYYSFNLQSLGTTNYQLVADQESVLFSFQNTGNQWATATLIDSLDTFAKSVSSTKINMGNQISILGEKNGTTNIYIGNVDEPTSKFTPLNIYTLYPNPVSDKVTLEWYNNMAERDVTVNITEGNSGLLIQKTRLSNIITGHNITQLQMDNIPNGQYVIPLQSEVYKSKGLHINILK